MLDATNLSSKFRFPKALRLISRDDFNTVYHGGDHFAADDVLVIRAVRNELNRSRLGLAISKKVGNAVVRNRWKRRIRESFRLQQHDLPKGLDFVVRPRKGAVCDSQAIASSIAKLLQRLDRKIK